MRSCPHKHLIPSRAAAFTLIELMVVVAIMAILASIGLPSLKGLRQVNTVKSAARQLSADVALARMKAISHRSTVYMVFSAPGVMNNIRERLTADQPGLRQWTNLVRGQFTTYALFTERVVGAQPGKTDPRYLTDWRSFPDGVFIATSKFQDWSLQNSFFSSWKATTDVNTRPLPYGWFPVPDKKSADYSIYARLPFIAFNSQGQLSYAEPHGYHDSAPQAATPYLANWAPRYADACIPLARGSIFFPKSASGSFLPADVVETPPGNSTNTYNRIRVNWLTGRARIEQKEIQ
jgi:prepilin-type N-terminal cleavage/methylation domain-containing protein